MNRCWTLRLFADEAVKQSDVDNISYETVRKAGQMVKYYQQLLALPTTWKVEDVLLLMLGKQIEIHLEYTGKKVDCLDCGKSSSIYDKAPEQRWRYLDTMQY